jgi:hypothetical protein
MSSSFFHDIQKLKDYDVSPEVKRLWYDVMAEEFLIDIRDQGGVYSLKAKKLLELLED